MPTHHRSRWGSWRHTCSASRSGSAPRVPSGREGVAAGPPPPVGWASVLGGGTIAGIGFTVSLLIATLALTGPQLQEAKLGVLSTAVLAPLATWLVYRLTTLL